MTETKKPKKKLKREFIEWGLIIAIGAVLYLTGLHTEVIGGLQRVLLATGIFQPDTELVESDFKKAALDFPVYDAEGTRISLEDFEGKTIFMNFWATWCPPCIAEMPNIQGLYEKLEDNPDIVFIMLSLDEDHAKAREFMKRKEFTMPLYFPAGRMPGVYSSTVVPTTYIISPEGYIVSEKRGMAKYNTEGFREFLLSL